MGRGKGFNQPGKTRGIIRGGAIRLRRYLAVSLPKICPTAGKRSGITALGRCGTKSSLSDLPTGVASSGSLAPDIGVEINESMSEKIKYTDEPLGKLRVVLDFLPSPEELAFRDDTVKVTIALSKSSIAFFKREAKKHNTQYQKMIRRLLDAYTEAQPLITRSTGRARKRRAG